MNIFYLDNNPKKAAEYHVDKHVVKMILESAQLLSTAHRVLDGEETQGFSASGRKKKVWKLNDKRDEELYSATHIHHPSAVWARQSALNYSWLHSLMVELCKEYTHRYGKRLQVQDYLEQMEVPESLVKGKLTEFAQAMPDQYRDRDAVKAYRNYYLGEKLTGTSWRWQYKNREKPDWAKVLDEI